MLHAGSRSEPSVLKFLATMGLFVIVAVYVMISLGTGDFLWFYPKFSHTPETIVVHCYGETIEMEPGSYHFEALTKITNESLSGRKRWDPLTMSQGSYQDYQTHPGMMTLELFYPEAVRVSSQYRFYSNVDNLVIPLEGRHADSNAIFGQNDGVTLGGSLHVESTDPIRQYLHNQNICPARVNSN